MPKSTRRRHRTIFALVASGVTAEVWLGLKEAAAAETATTLLGLPGVGTCATVLAKSAGVLIGGLGVNRWSTVLDEPKDNGLNADLDKASGRAIAAVIRNDSPALRDKIEDLEKLAEAVKNHHDPEELDAAAGELPLDGAAVVSNPAGFLNNASLNEEVWGAYLKAIATRHKDLSPLMIQSNLDRIAGTLSKPGPDGYNEHLYKELKTDAGIDGRAFGGAVLRMLNTVLEQIMRMREDSASTTEATWKCVKKMRQELNVSELTAKLKQVLDKHNWLEAEVKKLGITIVALPQALDEILKLQRKTLANTDELLQRTEMLEEGLGILREWKRGKPDEPQPIQDGSSVRALPEGMLDLRKENREFDLRDLVHGVVPDLASSYDFEHESAWTKDDKASLGLIGAAIENCANEEIQVIGRGPQSIDLNTDAYVAAVARAILRGVRYRRILFVDEHLPANGVLWLLLLERFMAESRWRDQVELRIPPECPQESTTVPQFQILDRAFVHRTRRSYREGEEGASRKVLRADFFLAPSHHIRDAVDEFEEYVSRFGTALSHSAVAERLRVMLSAMDADGPQFHWRHVLLADRFLDSLEVQGLPGQHVHFVGCLMPTTFTHEAASLFAAQVGKNGERFVPLPFESLDEAIQQFNPGSLEYICVPVENTKIGSIVPPMESYHFEKLKRESEVVGEVRLPVRFVIASKSLRLPAYRGLVAVQPALAQLEDLLDAELSALPRNPGVTPQSNHAAAVQAREDPTLVALTTEAAAVQESLEIHQRIPGAGEVNETVFKVFATPGR